MLLRLPRPARDLPSIVGGLAATAFSGSVWAAPPGPGFSSDRPGFANTSAVAARGRLTSELGFSGAFDSDGSTLGVPNLSLRTGLLSWFEVRVRAPHLFGTFSSHGDDYGMADPVVGFKIGGAPLPRVSLSSVSEISIPWGTDGLRSPAPDYSADLTIDWAVGGPLTLTPNTVVVSRSDLDPDSGELTRRLALATSLKLSWQMFTSVGTFVQSYAWFDERDSATVQLGGGVMWMVAPRVQVDASFDAGLTDPGDAPTVGIGTTVLW